MELQGSLLRVKKYGQGVRRLAFTSQIHHHSIPRHKGHLRWRRRHLHKLDAYPATASSSLSGAWQIVVAVAVAAVAFMAALVLAALIWLRPVIQELQRLLITCRATAESIQRSTIEFEKTSKIMNDDLPATLESMEKASLEFEELGQSLNILTGGFVKRNKASLQKRSGHQQTAKETKMETYSTAAEAETIKAASLSHDWSVVDALQAGTLASIRKIATDVSSLTATISPAIIGWRKRLGFALERTDEKAPQELADGSSPAIAQPLSSSKGSPQDSAGKPQHPILKGNGDDNATAEISQVVHEAAQAAVTSLHTNSQEHADLLVVEKRREKDSDPRAETISPLTAAAETTADRSAPVQSGDQDQALSGRKAAQSVFAALAAAEKAALAAAEASGQLEDALENAERQAGVSGKEWELSLLTGSDQESDSYDDGMANVKPSVVDKAPKDEIFQERSSIGRQEQDQFLDQSPKPDLPTGS